MIRTSEVRYSRSIGEVILTELRPRYFENEPDFRPMHAKFERLLSKSLTTMEVMAYDLVVHTGPGRRGGQLRGMVALWEEPILHVNPLVFMESSLIAEQDTVTEGLMYMIG